MACEKETGRKGGEVEGVGVEVGGSRKGKASAHIK